MADFATVAELELATGMVGLGARGTAILGYASAEIRNYLGQDVDVTTGRQEEYAAEWNRYIIQLTQVPVTAVSEVKIDGVVFTEFFANYMTGDLWRNDGFPWDEGPILVTYDSGFGATSDELIAVKSMCIEIAKRALSPGAQETFGLEVVESRGSLGEIFLTDKEERKLNKLAKVAVG